MKPDKKHIEQIRKSFDSMKSKKDLLALLNEAKPLVYDRPVHPFKLQQLTWYSNPGIGMRRYQKFSIPKKDGTERIIHAPVKGLKSIQKTLAFVLQCVFPPHEAAMGFVWGSNVVSNASKHINNRYVYNLDLKDFFSSVNQARVWKCFQLKPFSLDGDRLQLANMLAALCCTELEVERLEKGEYVKQRENVLPQGAPTSPVITNIVCQRLDFLLSGVAKRFGLRYSRYADDITFSSLHNVYQENSDFIKELQRVIADQGFYIKESKTRLQGDGYRKEVTGLVVNDKVNVRKSYIKDLRMWLYYWERYGYERANSYWMQNVTASKIKDTTELSSVLEGKLNYLKMVKGENNETCAGLIKRFEFLKKDHGPVTSTRLVDKPTSKKSNIKSAGASKGKIIRDISSEFPFDEADRKSFEEALAAGLIFGDKISIERIKKRFETENEPEYSPVKSSDINAGNKKNSSVSSDNKTPSQLKFPIIHTPKTLVNLLKNFSANDSALKYTTHSWDAGRDANMFKDLSEFLSIAESQYKTFSYKLKELSEYLNSKIYNFLFNKEVAKFGWGDFDPKKRIYFGWSSPELIEACKNDISLNPEDFILPEKFQIQRFGKTLQKFKHIIDVFKNQIEVRDENSALLNLILQKHGTYLPSFSPPKVYNLENKTFYTDIQWLSKALDLIFEGIQKYPQHPDVEYAVSENNNDKLVLTILHRNSFKNGLSIHDDKLNLERGDFSTIKDALKNLCDWSVESKFVEGAYQINYLVSDNGIPAYNKIDSTEGFKHLLTFYK